MRGFPATLPSTGRLSACFARFQPRLMSDVERQLCAFRIRRCERQQSLLRSGRKPLSAERPIGVELGPCKGSGASECQMKRRSTVSRYLLRDLGADRLKCQSNVHTVTPCSMRISRSRTRSKPGCVSIVSIGLSPCNKAFSLQSHLAASLPSSNTSLAFA